MATTVIKNIQFKRGNKELLEKALILTETKDNRLKAGEPAFEIDTGQLKIGTGQQDYIDLPYVGTGQGGGGGEDDRFVIHEPSNNQILLYDATLNKWVNKDLSDKDSIIYLNEKGLSIKGYSAAKQGQMLVKDESDGLAWINPLSTAELDVAVNNATVASNQAGTYATQAGNAATAADKSAKEANRINQVTMDYLNQKFWWGTLEEYNKLPSINKGTFYFIRAED